MFFTLSKIFWSLAQPLNALCLLALLGLAVRFFWVRAGQGMMMAALAGILLFGIVPVGPWALTWLERQYPAPQTLPPKIDGVIVLGGAFESYLSRKNGQIVANGDIERMLCFVEIVKAHPQAKAVFSGGSGDILNPDARESEDAKAFFKLAGLEGREIFYETQSRNTYENAVYTKKMMAPEAGQVWVVITSAFHMPRAMGVFGAVGWPVIPYQCDPKTDGSYGFFNRLPNIAGNFSALNIAIKEIIGLIVYHATGKSAFILPGGSIPSEP